jgi:hypothetical protein
MGIMVTATTNINQISNLSLLSGINMGTCWQGMNEMVESLCNYKIFDELK